MSGILPYTHWAYFPKKTAAEACARDLTDYVTRITPTPNTLVDRWPWLLRAGRDVQIEHMAERHREIEAVVARHRGFYDSGEVTYLAGQAIADPDLTNLPGEPATRDDVVRDYVQALLRQWLADKQAVEVAVCAREADGNRVIDGGQIIDDEWEIFDWRTGDTLASGTGGLLEYDDAGRRLDPDGKWLHIDRISTAQTRVKPVGLPASLAWSLETWLLSPITPDEEVAAFVGWSVEEVARHREVF